MCVGEGRGSVEPQDQVVPGQTLTPGTYPLSAPLPFSGFLLLVLGDSKQPLTLEPVCSFQGQKES